MTLLSTNYPVKHTTPNGDYVISKVDESTPDTSEDVFSGNAYSGNSDYSTIDVSEIGKEYLTTDNIIIPKLQDDYTYITDNITGNIYNITYINGQYIAVGSSGGIFTSEDLLSWNQLAMLGSQLDFMLYANGIYLTGGTGGSVFYSENLYEWIKTEPSENTVAYRDAIFQNGVFYIVGTDGIMYYSSDAKEWFKQIISTDLGLYSIIYNNGKYLIGDTSGGINYSTDTINWTRIKLNNVDVAINSITYGDGLYVAVGNNTTIIYSPDAINWTTVENLGESSAFNDVSFGNGVFVAVGSNSIVAYSYDAINWTFKRLSFSSLLLSVFFNGSQFIVTGVNAFISYSTDGIDWIEIPNYVRYDVVYNNNIYVTAGNNSIIAYSNNARNWNIVVVGSGVTWRSITYGDGLYVAVGNTTNTNAFVAYSPDAINWTVNRISSTFFYSIAYGNGLFVIACGNGNIYYSSNAIDWLTINISSYVMVKCIYINNMFIVCGQNGYVYYSYNGTNWTGVIAGANLLNGITYGDGKYVTVSSNGNVYYSFDLVNWVTIDATNNILNDIDYNELLGFVAVGNNTIGYSKDAIEWEFEYLYNTLNSVLVFNNNIIAVGNYLVFVDVTSYGNFLDNTLMVGDFTIQDNTYTLAYDYNTEYMSELGDVRLNNDPISNRMVRGAYATLSFYDSIFNRSKLIEVLNNDSVLIQQSASMRSFNFWFSTLFASTNEGDTIKVRVSYDNMSYEVDYEFIERCRLHHMLYYVNKYGAVDSLLVEGRIVESFQNSKYQINKLYDRSSESNFQKSIIQNTATRKWQLSTGFLSDTAAKKIDHILLSPKIWLHDLERDLRFAAIIADNSFTVKNFHNGKRLVSYSFNVEQSQDIIRR